MKAIVVLTQNSLTTLLDEGGSQAWKLDPNRAGRAQYVVCAHNHVENSAGSNFAQGQAFVIGKISSITPAQPPHASDRHMIEFDEYAELDLPKFWDGSRNPVRYIDLEDSRIELAKLKFKKNTQRETASRAAASSTPSEETGLNMAEAKKALSTFYGVPVTAIEITIRG